MLDRTDVQITGSNFIGGASVQFDSSPATNVVVVSSDMIDCTVPLGHSGPVDVLVVNPDDQEGTLTDGFTYYHNAMVFDGVDDGLFVESFPVVDGPFTVELWLRPGFSGGGINPRLIELVGANNTTFRLGLAENQSGVTSRRVNFELYLPSRQDTMSEQYLEPGIWYHVAAVYDGSQQILYINGDVAVYRPASGTPRQNSVLEIGTGIQLTGISDCFDGVLDEVRVWNDGRTQAEIQESMNSALVGDEQGLVAYWNLDEGMGQIALDVTSNGLDAILGTSEDPDQNDPNWIISELPLNLP